MQDDRFLPPLDAIQVPTLLAMHPNDEWILTLCFWIFFSVVAGAMYRSKGRSFFLGFLFSVVLTPVVGIVLALISPKNQAAIEKQQLASGAGKSVLSAVK